jgi:DNA-binding CsgD family transcriptional regulator
LGSAPELSLAYCWGADYGLVYMETGAHPPGEPAVPGEERADAGVPAAAAFAPTRTLLLDRELERGQIDRVLEAARRGRSAALVLHGEPGTGKTMLLDYAVESGGGFEIVRLLGIESETEFGFAALHQLLLPFLGGLRSLPAPQRDALAGALGLRRPDSPDRFLVALAALTMLARAAAKWPLLCIVDDAQWLDRESAGILGFIARRLSADAVAMLFVVRGPSERIVELEGLPWVQIGGLPPDEAGQLLASAVAGRVDRGVSERVIAQTGGNPLGLIDLGGELSREQLAGEISLPDLLPLGGSLQARYLRQVRCLPGETQIFLLAAAADPTGDPALLWRAGEFLGFGVRAAAPAEVEGLLRVSPLVRFRHPLIRSAVYHGATLAERVRVHEALAKATDPQVAADLRVWHRAEAAIGPDEDVAAELERAADRARIRGGWAASARFLTRAATLTPDAESRFRRVLAAAQGETTAGGCVRAQALLDSVSGQLDDPVKRAAVQRIQGTIRYALDQTAEAASVLLDAARQLAPLDAGQARATLLEALAAARISGGLGKSGAGDADIAQAIRALPLPSSAAATIGDLVLDADATLLLDGHEAAVPVLKRAVTAMLEAPISSAELLTLTGVGCTAAGALGDDHALYSLANWLEVQARDQGAVLPLSTALIFSGSSELFAGHLGQARARYAERGAIEAARGGSCEVGLALVLAWRGRTAEARAQAAAAAQVATERGHGWKLVWLEYAHAVLALAMGRYEEAMAAAPHGYEENVLVSTFALPDLIEAAVRCGERASAEQALALVARRAAASPTPLTLGLLARSRALLRSETDAETSYREAISHLQHARGRAHLARTELLYGEWLRREKRQRDAREHLQAAYGTFQEIGADAFAERARLELAATGQTARKPAPSHRGGLTPQELQVAALAAAGFTNSEIATRLFISPKTVDYHLGKVFRKLGVRSRRHLARVPLDQANAVPPTHS